MDCHIVPRFYLAQFADPSLQRGGKKRVWKYRFDIGKWKSASPRSVASEIDYYVAVSDTGERDERIERELIGPIEDETAKLFRNSLQVGVELGEPDRSTLAAFVALMSLRTRLWHETIADAVAKVSETALLMAASMAKSDPKSAQIRELLQTHRIRVGPKMPMAISLSLVNEIAAGIHRMGWTFVVARPGEYFISSDDPYRQVNPNADPPSPFGGLAARNIEVSLPLTRNLAFFAGWHSTGCRWVVAHPGFVDEINRRTCMSATIIVSPRPAVPGFEQIVRDWEDRKNHMKEVGLVK
ncbi:MAG: DUF4238 domain-containing protein [Gemmatimonadota bacterium]